MDFSDFTTFDFIVLSIIAITTLYSCYSGFVLSFLSLLKLFTALIATYYISPYLASIISNNLVRSAIIYIILFIILGILIRILIYKLSIEQFSMLNTSLGFAFGLTKGVIYVSLLFIVIMGTSSFISDRDNKDKDTKKEKSEEKKAPSWLKESKTYGLLLISSDMMIDFIPKNTYKYINNTVSNIEERLNKKNKDIDINIENKKDNFVVEEH